MNEQIRAEAKGRWDAAHADGVISDTVYLMYDRKPWGPSFRNKIGEDLWDDINTNWDRNKAELEERQAKVARKARQEEGGFEQTELKAKEIITSKKKKVSQARKDQAQRELEAARRKFAEGTYTGERVEAARKKAKRELGLLRAGRTVEQRAAGGELYASTAPPVDAPAAMQFAEPAGQSLGDEKRSVETGAASESLQAFFAGSEEQGPHEDDVRALAAQYDMHLQDAAQLTPNEVATKLVVFSKDTPASQEALRANGWLAANVRALGAVKVGNFLRSISRQTSAQNANFDNSGLTAALMSESADAQKHWVDNLSWPMFVEKLAIYYGHKADGRDQFDQLSGRAAALEARERLETED